MNYRGKGRLIEIKEESIKQDKKNEDLFSAV